MKHLVLILSFLLTSSLCFAEDVIQGHYCYTYGDRESLQEARELTHSLAIRNAIESYRTFIRSTSTVKNFQLTNDLIQIISSGYLKNVRVTEQKKEGKTICETIQAMISPEAMENIIKDAREKIERAEEKGIASNGYVKILNSELLYDGWGSLDLFVVAKYLRQTHEEKLRTVFVDIYDSNGMPIEGMRHDIGGNLYEGEIRSLRIRLTKGAFSYRICLYQEK